MSSTANILTISILVENVCRSLLWSAKLRKNTVRKEVEKMLSCWGHLSETTLAKVVVD